MPGPPERPLRSKYHEGRGACPYRLDHHYHCGGQEALVGNRLCSADTRFYIYTYIGHRKGNHLDSTPRGRCHLVSFLAAHQPSHLDKGGGEGSYGSCRDRPAVTNNTPCQMEGRNSTAEVVITARCTVSRRGWCTIVVVAVV